MLDRDRRWVVALVQAGATVAAIALFVMLDEAWYFRLVPALLVLLIANMTLREWLRRRVPPVASSDGFVPRSRELTFASLVVTGVGLCIVLFLPAPSWISGALGLLWILACPWRPFIRGSERLRRAR
jgi:hypothetical protein